MWLRRKSLLPYCERRERRERYLILRWSCRSKKGRRMKRITSKRGLGKFLFV